jgi:hypothetical protein
MGDLARCRAETEVIDRSCTKVWSLVLILAHPPAGRWKPARSIETVSIDRLIATRFRGREARPSLLDIRSRYHAVEQQTRAAVADRALGKADKRPVNIMLGNRDRHAVEIG